MTDTERPLVAHVIFRLAVGGLENGLVNLINRIPHGDFRHAIVCVDSFTDFKDRIERDDVEIVAINKNPGTDPGALLRLYRVFRRMRPEIVHTRNLAALDALLPAFLAGVRVRIHGEHGWDVDDIEGRNRKNLWLRRLHAPLVTRYVTVSKNLESYLTERVGVSSSRVTQICNGVDTSKFHPLGPDSRDQLPVPQRLGESSLLIGTVGRLNPVKDQLNLVDAFIQLMQTDPELRQIARLVIVGDGPLRESIVARIENAELSDFVWIPGSRDDIPQILQSLDLFVLPSLAEGISNTILEAMASGVPVIATNVGGNPELVENGATGCIVEPANSAALAEAIAEYVNNRDLLRRHGLAARRAAEEVYGLDRMVESYRAVYLDMLR